MPLVLGARFGTYEILARVGAGGMGEVWRARDTRLDREVALKVLPPATFTDDTARARLLREARMASKLNHPHVCTIHEVGEAEGQAFIAMELVEGQSLAARLSGGALPLEQVLLYGQQVADALAHAHEKRVVHRDLKSANVVLTPEGRAKVLDFGLAKRLAGEDLSEGTTAEHDTLTSPGTLAGTLAYMAPEQLRGKPADARSDIWALGVMLYEMATGRRPFQGPTGFSLSSAILNEPPPPLPATTPAELRAVIERCLAKEPGQRYQRAGEVRAALETVRSGGTLLLPRPATSAPSRRFWLAAAAALLLVVAVLAVLDVGGLRRRFLGGPGTPARAIKMAVLPFANLTGDPEQEYLSDGVTQEMIARLGRLHPESLSVIARTSVMRYKKTDTPIDQIGRELGVDYVLEGSAQREDGRIRISAELIQVRDQTQLWAEVYEREFAGILALQSDVARKVAGALALKLLPAEQARLANVRTVDPEAYEAYLRGSQAWTKMTKNDLDAAEGYFTMALGKDPNFAAAHAGMSWVWACRNQLGFTPPGEAGPRIREAAQKALSLDDTLAEAHYALATVKTYLDWDLPAAGQEWRRAVELDPNYAEGLAAYSHFLAIMGRTDEAMAQVDRAVGLDPFNVMIHIFRAADLFFVRRFDEAEAELRKALAMGPGNPAAIQGLYWVLAAKGMEREALAGIKDYCLIVYDMRDICLRRREDPRPRLAGEGLRGARPQPAQLTSPGEARTASPPAS